MEPVFSKLDCSQINFLFYSAMKYNAKIKYYDIKNRKRSSFLLILKGEYLYTFDGGSFTASENTLVYLPKGGRYTYKIRSKETECMQIEFDTVMSFFNNKALTESPLLITFEHQQDLASLKRTFEKIIELYQFKSSGYPFSINANLFKIFSLLIKNEERSIPKAKSKIRPAVSYIERNYTKKISSAYLAKLCVISESQLRKLFCKELGVSPLEYKRKLQLEYAITLIESENYRISQIAELVGFDTVYAFSAFFKKETGLSPKHYNKAY